MRMKPLVLTFAFAAALSGALPGQSSLAGGIPEDVFMWFRWEEPMAALDKGIGAGLFGSDADRLRDGLLEQLDRGLSFADAFTGAPSGSVSGYLRSIQAMEGVIYNLEVVRGGAPDFDFALLFDTPQADRIYDLASGQLLKRGLGSSPQAGELDFDAGDVGLALARRNDLLLFGSDQSRLRKSQEHWKGSGAAKGLANSKLFRRAMGTDDIPGQCSFFRLDRMIRMGLDLAPDRFQDRARRISQAFGIDRLAALGFVEGKRSTRMAIIAQDEVEVFKALGSGKASSAATERLPSDLVFSFQWNGSAEILWERLGRLMLDRELNPFADFGYEQIRLLQKRTGAKLEEVLALGREGFVFGVLPDDRGRIDDDEDSLFLVLPGAAADDQLELIRNLGGAIAERLERDLVETRESDGFRWQLREPQGEDLEEIELLSAGRDLYLGKRELLDRIIAARTGQAPSLASAGRIRPQGTEAMAWSYIGVAAIMMSSRDLSMGAMRLRPDASVLAKLTATPTEFIVTTDRPLGEVANAFAMAGAARTSLRTQVRSMRSDLRAIAKDYRRFMGDKSRTPRSLMEIGYSSTSEKKLKMEGTPSKLYELLTLPEPGENGNDNDYVATVLSGDYGFYAVTMKGRVRSLRMAEWRRIRADSKARTSGR